MSGRKIISFLLALIGGLACGAVFDSPELWVVFGLWVLGFISGAITWSEP